MPYIHATDRPLLWAVIKDNLVSASGLTEIGGATLTGEDKTLVSNASENAFLGAVAGKVASYNPLPDIGEPLEAGAIYGYGGGLVIVRQSHVRTEHAPEDVPALLLVYREGTTGALEWVANERVEVGTQRTYAGKTWRALQAHTTQADWTPPVVPALWREVVVTPPTAEWAVGVVYKVGDIVTYQGAEYRCLQSHTSQAGWHPVAVPALWLLISPA